MNADTQGFGREGPDGHKGPKGQPPLTPGPLPNGRGEVRRLSVHFQSKTCEWETPQWLFEALNGEFGFTLDPCATSQNAKCARFFSAAQDGLAQDWGKEVVFMNPPYGRVIGKWMRKALESAQAGAKVVCLVPARTDTEWWHRYAMSGEIRFLKGRVKFGGAANGAPFPSAVVVFRPPKGQARSQEQVVSND